jgi:hypothetical protein
LVVEVGLVVEVRLETALVKLVREESTEVAELIFNVVDVLVSAEVVEQASVELAARLPTRNSGTFRGPRTPDLAPWTAPVA